MSSSGIIAFTGFSACTDVIDGSPGILPIPQAGQQLAPLMGGYGFVSTGWMKSLPISIGASSVIGTAAATVDKHSMFLITATAAGLALTLPNPTDTTKTRIATVTAVGANSFTMYGFTISGSLNREHRFLWLAGGSIWYPFNDSYGSVPFFNVHFTGGTLASGVEMIIDNGVAAVLEGGMKFTTTTSPTRIRVPETGLYKIDIVTDASTTLGTEFGWNLRTGGTDLLEAKASAGRAAGWINCCGSTIVRLNANTDLNVVTTGASVSWEGTGWNTFSCFKISD